MAAIHSVSMVIEALVVTESHLWQLSLIDDCMVVDLTEIEAEGVVEKLDVGQALRTVLIVECMWWAQKTTQWASHLEVDSRTCHLN